MAFTVIQAYAVTNYGQSLAADICTTVFLTFAGFCLVSPGITNILGARLTLFLGGLGYCAFIMASLVYFKYKEEYLVLLGAVVLGVSASLLWIAEGRLILEYANIAEDGGGSGLKTGALLGIFWSLFQGSSLSGGLVAFFAYSPSSTGSDSNDGDSRAATLSHASKMYTIFFFVTFVGACAVFMLATPSALRRYYIQEEDESDQDVLSAVNESKPLLSSSLPVQENGQEEDLEEILLPQHDSNVGNDGTAAHKSWWEESKQTLALFGSKRMMLHFAALFFFTGFTQPYQLENFSNRFFDEQTLGLELMIFYSAEIISGFVVGYVLKTDDDNNDDSSNNLDNDTNQTDTTSLRQYEMVPPSPPSSSPPNTVPDQNPTLGHTTPRRRAAIRCLVILTLATTLGNILALVSELGTENLPKEQTALHYTDPAIIGPTIAFACWGFSDGFVQTYAYWLIGYFYGGDGDEQSRAVGFYRCLQSLGWSVGCALMPTDRLSSIGQLSLIIVVFVLGVGLSLLELPR